MLASFFTAQAQTIVSTDFGTDEASYQAAVDAGWGSYAFDQDGDFFSPSLEDLQLGFTGVYMISGTVKINDDETLTDLQPVNFITSPAIDLTGIDNSYIKFKAGAFGAEDAVMGFQVLVIPEADWSANPQVFTNVVVAAEGSIAAGQAGDVTVALDDFADQNIRIFILHVGELSTSRGWFLVDDISVNEGVAGVKENLISKFSVFPNPANDVVNVTNNENILVNGVEVVDLNGRTVKSVTFGGVANAQINVSDLASGVYMMTVSSDKGTMTKKIVKN